MVLNISSNALFSPLFDRWCLASTSSPLSTAHLLCTCPIYLAYFVLVFFIHPNSLWKRRDPAKDDLCLNQKSKRDGTKAPYSLLLLHTSGYQDIRLHVRFIFTVHFWRARTLIWMRLTRVIFALPPGTCILFLIKAIFKHVVIHMKAHRYWSSSKPILHGSWPSPSILGGRHFIFQKN